MYFFHTVYIFYLVIFSDIASPSQPIATSNNHIIGSPPSNSDFDDVMTDLSSSAHSQAQNNDIPSTSTQNHQQPQPFGQLNVSSTRFKRPSSSLSSTFATSPLENHQRSMCDFIDEPPSKQRAVQMNDSNGYNSFVVQAKQRMELIMDVEDVQNSGQELSSTVLMPTQQTTSTTSYQSASTSTGAHSPASSSTSSQSVTPSTTNSDLGRSLLAGVCSNYSPHFVLSGVDLRECEVEDTFNAIYDDVKHPTGEPCDQIISPSSSTSSALAHSTIHSTQSMDTSALPPRPSRHRRNHSNVETNRSQNRSNSENRTPKSSFEGPTSAVVVVGDLTDWSVRVVSAQNCKVEDQPVISPSDSIVTMLEQFSQLHSLSLNPTFMISFLEDTLTSLLTKSQTLVKLITAGSK